MDAKYIKKLKLVRACDEAVNWFSEQESPEQAWQDCPRGDWMIWLIGKTIKSEPWSDDRKPLLALCLDVADTVKHLRNPAQADNIKNAISVLRKWIKGKATIEEAKEYRNQLYAAYAAADANAAAYAAYAADAAAADANAAAYAAYAADAADAAARTKYLKQSANIVRKHYPSPPTI